jgi:hypothetical protein
MKSGLLIDICTGYHFGLRHWNPHGSSTWLFSCHPSRPVRGLLMVPLNPIPLAVFEICRSEEGISIFKSAACMYTKVSKLQSMFRGSQEQCFVRLARVSKYGDLGIASTLEKPCQASSERPEHNFEATIA